MYRAVQRAFARAPLTAISEHSAMLPAGSSGLAFMLERKGAATGSQTRLRTTRRSLTAIRMGG